jgi:hypothetical protein
MPHGLYKWDPLTSEERDEYENDLISFCDRELDLLGDIEGLDVLYAGGSSLLWIEGLSQRIGEKGSLNALDTDVECLEEGRELLREADLAAPVQLVAGDVFRPPFAQDTFSLAYSSGLFHELDIREKSAGDALAALASVVRAGGRIATSDFVDTVSAAQLEDEELQRELARETKGTELYGIGPPERLVRLHEALLVGTRWRALPPNPIRHLGKIVLVEEEPKELRSLPARTRRRLRERLDALRERIEREGYTRPASLYAEGFVTEN